MRTLVCLASPLLLLLPASLFTTACGSDDGGKDSGSDTVDADTRDTELELVDFDIREDGDEDGADDSEDSADTRDTSGDIAQGAFGAPCLSNAQCDSGWCVESEEGYVCTKECLEECPGGYDCKSVQNAKGDVTFLCLPRVQKLCVSCLEDFQCNGGACLSIAGDRQCASGCDEETDCPSGYTCQPDATHEKEGKFCQPVSGSCDCSPPFEGVTRLCTKTNDLGTCRGAETCDPEVGWVDCTAFEPVAEACDYIDNDCDGDVDESFKVDGVYATKQTCGSCSTNCDEVLANAAVTECIVTDGTARCQVVSCDAGYTKLNPFVCAPDSSSLCQPCITEAECLGTDAACTTLDDGDFCTLPCGEQDDCSDGYACRNTENGMQCVPDSGSCTCDGSNTNLARSCTKVYTPPDPEQPVVTCKGFEQCTATGWGGCDLPDEECDGIDNDCNGIVDGPFKTGDKYTAIEHCGACGISCLAFVRPNAAPVCDATQAVPTCTYECSGTAVDVNGESDDGCECVPVPGDDLAGDDLDSNCDGVDGEVAKAIFVSKDGDNGNPGTRDLPVLTIAVGLQKAEAGNKRDVYVATGVYSENVLLTEGVGLFGGYAPDFAEHDVLLFETAIIGGVPDSSHPGTVTAIGLGAQGAAKETVIDGFTIFGVNAGNITGGNSYAIYVRNSGDRLRIAKNRIFGGPGGPGAGGARGVDGANGIDGSPGGDAKNLSSDCVTGNETGGGAGGVLTCSDGNPVNGGNGGRAYCPDYSTAVPNGAKGVAGQGFTIGLGGDFGRPFFICATDAGCSAPTTSKQCDLCIRSSGTFNAESGGNGGSGDDGNAGTTGSAAGSGSTGEWVGSSGGDGGAGSNGSGGGGGGAGAGVEVDGTDCSASAGNDDVGGAGGGGGSGGCFATGGKGGKPGGGSFGIFIVGSAANHTPRLIGNTVQSGRGGAGGAGGAGGVGGAGGNGGAGGTPGDQLPIGDLAECATGGGNGGAGGSGGHGGGGGGGAGGPSYGLFVSLPVTAPAEWKTGNTFVAGGQGGGGGNGGVSIDQASSGANGATGSAANTNF